MSSIGNLYSKSILVRLTNSKSEDKYKSIKISVDYQTSIQPTHKTELIIKLTDQQDPFFLYSLFMSEEDYQTLKVQQGLLVDFSAFGQQFIDLLTACERDEKSANPKFQLQFYSKEPLPFDHDHASLNIIEINPFKHLYHLSLNFMPGNDSDVKKYLATCLSTIREDYAKLTTTYNETKLSLTQMLESAQQALSKKNMDHDRLKVELDSQSERIQTKHIQELNFERDKSMQNQYANQQKWEKDKKEMEINYLKSTKQFETRVYELEINNKELLEKKYKNESQLQELRLKNSSLNEEYTGLKQDLLNIRKQNSSMDSELHSTEKLLNQLRTRIAVLEQELKDKIDSINKSQDLFSNEQEKRTQIDELLKEKQVELRKKQAEINHYVHEFKKGNEVVIKLQSKEKTLVGQVKLKTRILNEQEKVMKEKEKEIDDLKSELKEAKTQNNDSTNENKDLKNTLQKKTVELDEAAKLLKRDENIISWLNKQITDNNLASNGKLVSYESGHGAGAGLSNNGITNGSGGLFKPFGSLTLNNNSHSPSLSNTNNDLDTILNSNGVGGMLRSTALGSSHLSQNTYMNKTEIDNRRLMLSNGSQMQMYSTGNVNSSNVNSYQQRTPLSSSSSSSIQQSEALKENHEIDTQSVRNAMQSNQQNRLDPKYFQSHQTIMSDSSKPQQQPLIKTNGIRINKQLVQSGSSSIPNGSQTQVLQQHNGNSVTNGNGVNANGNMPSLASAYFPSN